jgi:serine/threonine protein kinase
MLMSGDSEPRSNDNATRALRKSASDSNTGDSGIGNINQPTNTRQRLVNYELGDRIGTGGMGTVFRATHVLLGRTVAIKFISPEVLGDPEAALRFVHETRAIGALDHPNIVRATDAGCENGVHFLVTEYIEGEDLAQLIKRRGPLSVADACEVICQAALGLAHAHERGLVHRDIKPSNLRIDRTGVVKLLDFGLAHITAGETMLTNPGQMIGTLDFIAPEQLNDARNVSGRADIYSLGCTLWFLLTGTPPFSGPVYSTPASKIKGHLADQPVSATIQHGKLPSIVFKTLERMMCKEPSERYASPSQVVARLAPYAKSANTRALISERAAPPANDGPQQSAEESPIRRAASAVGRAICSLLVAMFWGRRRGFAGQSAFGAQPKREPMFSIGGVIGFLIIAFALTRFVSCTPIENKGTSSMELFGHDQNTTSHKR